MGYHIGQVGTLLRVSVYSLRSWEKQGFIPKPSRCPTGLREYTDDDLKAIMEFLGQKKHLEGR